MPQSLPGDGNLDIRRIVVSQSATGDLLGAQTSPARRIRVVSGLLFAAGAVDVKFRSGTTDLCGVLKLSASGDGFALAESMLGHVETVAGEALNLHLSASVVVSGFLNVIVGD